MGGMGREKKGTIAELTHLPGGVAVMIGKVTQLTQRNWLAKYGNARLSEMLIAFYNQTSHLPHGLENLPGAIAYFLKRESDKAIGFIRKPKPRQPSSVPGQ